jgi:rhodanese-related sulfurtransferase
LSQQETPISEVAPKAAYDAVASGHGVIIDVRESDELQEVAVDDAIHIPLGQLPSRAFDVPQDKDVYIICRSGNRSGMATEFLQGLGHPSVHNIEGGIIDWIKAQLPVHWGEKS